MANGYNTFAYNTFTSNTANQGSAIYASGSSNTITSNTFTGNIASGTNARGGAIFVNGTYNTITSNTFEGNSAGSRGGAIYAGSYNTIINNIFAGNSASTYGGAIYLDSTGNTIAADNGTTLFQGNYVNNTSDNQAIYQAGANNKLNLSVINSGTMTFYDYITGDSGFDTIISGDATSTLNLYNQILNSDVSTSGGFNFNTANNSLLTYNFLTFNSDADTLYNIDIDLNSKTSDVFKTTNASSGTITLADLNIIAGDWASFVAGADETTLIQVIQTQNDNLQLALGTNLSNILSGYNTNTISTNTVITTDTVGVQADNDWSDQFGTNTTDTLYTTYTTKTLGLATSNTLNDSLGVTVVSNTTSSETITFTAEGEPIVLVARDTTNPVKTFTTDDPNAVYTLGYVDPTVTGIGPVSGTLTVSGAVNGDERSTLDLNGKKGFEVTSSSSTLNLSSMTITNAYKNGSTAYGAAVYQTNGTLNVDNVIFASNTGIDGMGGAVYANKNTTITNSIFDSNTEVANYAQGGAVWLNTSNTLTSSTFINNRAIGNQVPGGGAIYVNGKGNIINGNTFISNVALNNDGSQGRGGAIYINGDNTTIISNTFTSNRAKHGGALDIMSSNTITSNVFSSNVASGTSGYTFGGAISSVNTNTFAYNTFTSNVATQGGAIRSSNSNTFISNTFTSNVATNSATVFGGAIYANGNSNTFEGNIFEGNIASGTNTSQNYGGGAIYAGSRNSIINNTFTNNQTNRYGGAIYLQGNSNTITSNTFTGNTASGTTTSSSYGGAIYAGSSNIISDNTFTANKATTAAAIYAVSSNNITNNTFIENEAIYNNGGAVSLSDYNMVSGNQFIRNKGWYGGALAVGSNNQITSNTFDNNTARYPGGAVILAGSSNQVTNNDFINNKAGSGGAIRLTSTSNIISSNTFTGNEALTESKNGGAIALENLNAKQNTIEGNIFSSNIAYSGGAIYSIGSNNTFISNTFTSNIASGTTAQGGAIYLSSSSNTITNNTFQGNSAGNAGGAIYLNGSGNTIVADNGTTLFQGNYVGGDTSDNQAIYQSGATNTLNLSVINSGTMTFYDYITGDEGFTTAISGDATSTLNLYNQIKNSNVSTDGGFNFNTANNSLLTYNFLTFNSDADTQYTIDVDLNNKTSDVFKTTNASTGTVTLNSLNILAGDWASFVAGADETTLIQVLDTQNDNLQLALGSNLSNTLSGFNTNTVSSETVITTATVGVQADNLWTDQFGTNTTNTLNTTYTTKTLGLATSNTLNDSIGVTVVSNTTSSEAITFTAEGEPIVLVARDATNPVKTFTTSDPTAVYTLGYVDPSVTGIGPVSGTLTVSGAVNGDNRSTLDLNGKKGFEVTSSSSTLNLANMTITNGYTKSNGASVYQTKGNLNISNVIFSSNSILASGTLKGYGAAVYSTSSGTNINNSIFVGNTSSGTRNTFGATVYLESQNLITSNTFTNNVGIGQYAYGGAIYAGSSNMISSNIFSSNTVSAVKAGYGGALYISVGNTVINNIFTSNIASNDYISDTMGGAIFAGSSNTISSNIFSYNISSATDANGGAIRTKNYNIITNNVFTSNTATIRGGAIYLNGSSNTITSNTFAGNKAAYGGAIYAYGDSNIISSNIFTSNTASDTSAYGGAIRTDTNNTIINNTFENNIAEGENAYGGAMYVYGTSNTITNNTFQGNSAGNAGGAIYLNGSDNTISADAGTTLFQNNYVGTAGTDMQAIYQAGANNKLNLSVINSGTMTFYDYITGDEGFTTAISGDATSTLNLYNQIKNSNVSTDGGFNFNTANNSLLTYNFLSLNSDADTLYNIDIDLNSKTSDVFKTTNASTGTVTLNSLNILAGDWASFVAGANETTLIQVLNTQNDNLQLALGTTLSNTLGGFNTNTVSSETVITTATVGVQADNLWTDQFGTNTTNTLNTTYTSKTLGLATSNTLNDSIGVTVVSNTISSEAITFTAEGEPIVLVSRDATNPVKTFTTSDPTAVYTLGYVDPTVTGIGPVSGTLTVSGAVSGDNRSTLDLNGKSGFEVTSATSTLNLANMTITGSNKSGSGAAIYQTSGNLNVSNVLFTSNTASNTSADIYGGAIYADGNSSITSSTFTGNIASSTSRNVYGGAIYAGDSNSIINNTFSSNNASGKNAYGGAIRVGNSNTISSNVFEANISDGSAGAWSGAIYASENNIISYNTFSSNVASGANHARGAAIFVANNSNTITNNNFVANEGIGNTVYGGAIYLKDVDNTIQFNNFISNLASGVTTYGGAIALHSSSSSDIISSNIFIGNIASGTNARGGAIFANGSYNIITNNTFSGNIASGTSSGIGGAIYVSGSSNTITNNTFTGNSAGNAGGAIYLNGSDNTISADNGTTLFQGNYVGDDTIDNQAIYQAGASNTLNLSVVNSGTMTFYDYITGDEGFITAISGDAGSTLNLYNQIKNSNVSTDGGFNFNTANNSLLTYNFLSLNSDADTLYTIDIDLASKTSDVFKTTNASTGTVTLNSLNILAGDWASFVAGADETTLIQVLDTQNNNLQLALGTNLSNTLSGFNTNTVSTNTVITTATVGVQANNLWTDQFGTNTTDTLYTTYTTKTLGLATSNTLNDSIGVTVVSNTTSSEAITFTAEGEPIVLVARDTTNPVKTFTTSDPNAVYTLGYVDPSVTGIGAVSGTLTVSGAVNGEDRSTLDMNGHNGFVLNSADNKLVMSDLRVINGASGEGAIINNSNGQVSLSNVIISGNANSISNANEMSMSGMNELLAGVVGNGSLSISAGETKASTISQEEVNIENDGKLSMNASNLSADSLNNSGTLNFTGGENSNEVNGDGTTTINGEVVNSALIDQDVRIESGELTSSLANLGGAIANSGTLRTSGELDKVISGSGETINSGIISLASGGGIEGSLNLNDGTLNISSGSVTSHNIGNMVGNGSLSLDVDMTNNIADELIIGSIGSGVVTIDNVNILGALDDFSHVILNSNNIDEGFSLELAESVYNEFYSISSATTYDVDEVTSHTLWSDIFETDKIVTTTEKELSVANNTTLNYTTTISSEVTTSVNGDTLDLVVQANIGDREFVTNGATDSYTLSIDLGNMATGTLSIDGVVNGEDRSTLDMNGHSGFVLNSADNKLVMSDLRVINGASGEGAIINNSNGQVSLSNVIISGNANSISNANEMSMSGMNELLAGVVGNGSLSISAGETKASTISQEEVNIENDGKLSMNASNLSADSLNNSGTLNFTGGENSNEVNGDGTTTINGEVVNSALIDQDVRIESGELTSSLANLGGAIANSGTLRTSGELDKVISGSGETINSGIISLASGGGIEGSLNLNDGTLNISSGSVTSHNIGNMVGNGSLSLDVDMTNNIADELIIGSIGSGVVTIDNVNILGALDDFSHVILNSNNIDEGFSLELAESVYNEFYSISSATTYDVDEVTSHTLWSDIFETDKIVTTTEKELSVANNTTLNYTTTISSEVTTSVNGDTLDLVVQANIGDREFVTNGATDSYTLSIDLGNMATGTLSIDGVVNGEDRSTLDMNGHSGFVLDNDNEHLIMSDIKVVNASGTLIDNTSSDATITLTNVEIMDNTAEDAIIRSSGEVNIIADNATTSILDNHAADSIHITDSDLNLNAKNEGKIAITGNISGNNYDMNIDGDGTGSIDIQDSIRGAENIKFVGDSELHVGLNSAVYADNMKNDMDVPARLKLDMEVDREHNTINSGKFYIEDDISGEYSMIVNALNGDKLDNIIDNAVAFLYARNDDPSTASNIEVSRVYGSPHMWKAARNIKSTDKEGSTWYLALYDTERTVSPEVMAGIGLMESAIDQTRSVVRNVGTKVAAGNDYCPSCGVTSKAWDGAVLHNVWVLAQGESSNIDAPAAADGKLWEVEGGFDIQKDIHNTIGVFASYRDGKYELNGEGDKYHSTIASQIDIDSYLMGLYYRYDKDMNWMFATVYGGIQKAEAKSKDGVAKFDTDAKEYGASVEVGHTFALAKDLTLDPSLGVSYTNIDYDDTQDNVGKHYEWDDISQVEIELGAKLEKHWAESKVYVRPSIIRTMTHGDIVQISGMNKVNTYHDDTLLRLEIGGCYNFSDDFYGYAWANYTYGSKYDAISLGAGMNYSW